MKKSSLVVLTIVAALAMNSCAVQKTAQNIGPPDPVYAEQISDTTKPIKRDTVVQYNYYYRSYFWDDMYRFFFPHRYYYVINQPGFIPKRLRGHPRGDTSRSNRTPNYPRRGGFGGHGTSHTPVS